MIDVKPVIHVLGLLIIVFSLAGFFPLLMAWLNQSHEWYSFSIMIGLGIFFGVLMMLATSHVEKNLQIRQALLLTASAWIILPLLASVPFIMSSELQLSFIDAYFEAVSGLTTTGATVLTNLESTNKFLLVWRSLLQWLGGIGIIVMALAMLPMMRVGGMQIFKAEFSEKMERGLPRATSLSLSITLIYTLLTIACIILYYIAGMSPFDAFNHALTTVSTGGFSTHDTSFGFFNHMIKIIAVIFMILGSLPFILYMRAINGESFKVFFKDSQVKWFIVALSIMSVIGIISLAIGEERSIYDAMVSSFFTITSVMTGSGFVTEDYGQWQYFPVVFFFFLMFTGGCVGSTTCGIKIFRLQVLLKTAYIQLKRMWQPQQIHVMSFNRQFINDDIRESVMGFFILFIIIFAILASLLGVCGLDFLSSVSGAAASLANVGPGLGDVIGPSGNYMSITQNAKIIFIIGMIMGRLEIFTILVLFVPNFWRV